MPRRTADSSKTKLSSRRAVNSNKSGQKVTVVSGVRRSPGANNTQESSIRKSRQGEKRRSPNLLTSLLLYVLRIGIAGVGIGAIAGTTLTVFNPTGILAAYFKTAQVAPPPPPEETPSTPEIKPIQETTIPVSQELMDLKTKLQTIATKYPKIKPQAWFIDLDNGAYVSLDGSTPIPAASTIKVPVLVAFFEEVDKGNIHLDQMLTMDKSIITSGSGDMQYMQVGKKFTALEVATKMIIISDNTATDMLIRQIGGKEVLNQRFKEWGLTHTVINNPLPDLEGTNTTSSEDLAKLLARVERGDLISARSRDRLLGIMEQTKTRTLLPQGLEKDANIAHKTGDIGIILGDVGIIDIPTGKRYIGAVFAQRAYNDPAGRSLIQEFSRTVYQHFKYYQPRPVPKQVENKPQPQPESNHSNQPENKPQPQPESNNSNQPENKPQPQEKPSNPNQSGI
ncbi:serine hydrolase [Crocosphaera sp. XPORK-15E]|uniref:serine hydrolase n=1 Tax=Crocosphaera sp. XPORK-15E TaxID=3110247 RepID=UPI002B1F4B8A|nr:serine hydrolase [Crocosphaera sp. XPORK-15E]MEA5532876.1 serine hydrolase [Crocosphaera sp. XPORK-15E]